MNYIMTVKIEITCTWVLFLPNLIFTFRSSKSSVCVHKLYCTTYVVRMPEVGILLAMQLFQRVLQPEVCGSN